MGSLEGKLVNKTQLIDALAARYEGNRKQAAHALDSVLDTITREVARGEKVAITGFGSFEKAVREARWVRNPQTGERMKSKKKSVPKFTAGQELKNVISGAKKLPKLTVASLPKAPSVRAVTAAATAPARAAGAAARKATGTTKKATPAKTTAAKKTTTAKKAAPAKKTTTAKQAAPAKKAAPAKSTAAKKTTTKKATPAKSTAAKKTTTKKAAPAKSTAAKKTTAKKPAAKKS